MAKKNRVKIIRHSETRNSDGGLIARSSTVKQGNQIIVNSYDRNNNHTTTTVDLPQSKKAVSLKTIVGNAIFIIFVFFFLIAVIRDMFGLPLTFSDFLYRLTTYDFNAVQIPNLPVDFGLDLDLPDLFNWLEPALELLNDIGFFLFAFLNSLKDFLISILNFCIFILQFLFT